MFLKAILEQMGPKDTAVHLGPGVLYEERGVYSACKGSVLIAEPDPARAAKLVSGRQNARGIDILDAAVLAEGRAALLRRYNLPQLDSLRAPTGLNRLFPGLRELERVSVEAIAASAFAERLPGDHRNRDLLVIDALGEALDLLKAFEQAGVLERFSDLVIRTTRLSGFEGAPPLKEITDWLVEHRYDRPVIVDDSDPDLPVVCFKRNPFIARLADARRIAKEKEAEAGKAEQDLKVALRLQAAAQDDLKELQEHFTRLRREKDAQDELLRKVTGRLALASEQLGLDSLESVEVVDKAENKPAPARRRRGKTGKARS